MQASTAFIHYASSGSSWWGQLASTSLFLIVWTVLKHWPGMLQNAPQLKFFCYFLFRSRPGFGKHDHGGEQLLLPQHVKEIQYVAVRLTASSLTLIT